MEFLKNFSVQLCCLLLAACVIQAAPASEDETPDEEGRARGVVEGVRDCGSRGNVYQVRVEGCTQTPCQLFPENTYEIEVDFSTSTRGDYWRVVVAATAAHTSIIVLDETVEASIAPGERHTLLYELPVTTLFEGYDIEVQVQLIEAGNNVEEVCVAADAHVNEIPTTTMDSRVRD